MSNRKKAMAILINALLIFLVFFIYVRFTESRSVFYPYKNIEYTPKDAGLNYEDVYFKTKDGLTLNAWFVKKSDTAPTFIFLHGNAGNIGGRIEKMVLLNKVGVNVFIIDYRGYGKSQGKPSEAGIYKDALSAYDYLVSRDGIDKSKIIVYGVSLGGAPAIELATKRDISGLIIDSSFTSAADMAKKILPFVPGFMLKTKFDNVDKIKHITVPKMIMHSVDDQTIPFSLGQKLYNDASEPKVFLRMQGGHNDNYAVDPARFMGGITDFLKTYNLF